MSLIRLNFDVKDFWTNVNQTLPLQVDFEANPDEDFFLQKIVMKMLLFQITSPHLTD
jgi:hypothetical protein